MRVHRDVLLKPLAWALIVLVLLPFSPIFALDWLIRKTAPGREWKRWFAWRPVLTLDDYLVWLRFVERRKVVSWGSTDYRTPAASGEG